MNRIISLSVEDMYIKYTGEAFGATGSHNAVTLRMTFGPAWEGTAKTAYFTDALGNASVALVLGLDTLVDGAYEVDVPSEALKTAGVATITIKGVLVSGEITTKAITTAAGHFRVLDSELPDSAGNAGTITPSDKDQLQAEIAGMETLFTTAKAAAEAAAANAKVSETNAKTSETAAASSASSAEAAKAAAAESAATATAQASVADASAEKAAASQKAAQAAETNAKASEKAAAASQTGAETAAKSAQGSAVAAAKSAQTSQNAASTATGAASSADQSATSASGSASQAQTSAAAAADSAVGAETASKTAQSWAVGGTNTRLGEDTDNAKYWAQQAEAVVGGDFATKVEAQGYVTAHNQSDEAHTDIRNALNGKEASGTAAAAVTAHNKDIAAHADIREALAGKEAAGAAATVQRNLTAHAGNTTVHVTSEEKTAWNGKASGTHASQHGKDGTDPLTPTAIGAVGYDAAQSLTDGQKNQARGNIGAMQGIESTDHPGCYYVLNGSKVEWINSPMNGDRYTMYQMIDRYKAQPVYKGTLDDFEVWKPDSAVWPHGTEWGSAGKAMTYRVEASETKSIALIIASTFFMSWADNVRQGLVVVQTGSSGVLMITNVVAPQNWKIEIGTGLSVNVTELGGQWAGHLSVFMI